MYHHAPASRGSARGVCSSRPAPRSRARLLALAALLMLALGLPAPRPVAAAPHSSAAPARSARPALQASPAPLTISPPSLPSGRAGTPYQQAILASGGTAPYSFALTGGNLPPGLALSATGVLSGTPTSAGEYVLLITATDAQGANATQFYLVNIISQIAVSPPALPEGSAGSAYRQLFAASGGTAPYTFTMTNGTLPPGLSLSPAGLLSGVPTAPGFYSFIVDAADARGLVGSRGYGLLIAQAFSIAPSSLPAGEVGTSYSQALAGVGGLAPYSFALTSGGLPAGLSLSAAGLLSGTPTALGFYNFTITAADARGLTSQQFYSISIVDVPLTIGPASLSAGSPGVAYRQTLTASGGTKPYSFALDSGTLPPGLALGRDGRISGTPTAAGFFFFAVRATDARGHTGLGFYSIAIAQAPLTISPATLPDGKVGTAYRQDLTVSGGTRPYTLTLQGNLPPGLTLRSDGRLVGRPTAPGFYFFGIGAVDARGKVGGQFYSLRIAQAFVLSPSFLLNGMAGAPYQQSFTATGGKAPYTFALADGALPAGLTLTPNGAISGRPLKPGFYGFTISAVDSRGVVSTQSYAITILTPIAVSPPDLLGGRVGTPYQQAFDGSGGAAPYTFALASGALPPGLALSATGVLSGTPTSDGFYSFTISATDARGIAGSESYQLHVQQAVDISPPFLDSAQIDQPFSAQLMASGGSAPYTFVITNGAVPAGLSLSPDGLLSGTPTAPGFYNFVALATDARGLTGVQAYFLVVSPPLITVGPDQLPDGQVGVPYQQQLSASGGTGPYLFFAGSLPPGLVLRPDGLLHGTPTSAGFFTFFSISAVDARGNRGERWYETQFQPITISPATLPTPVAGVPYSTTLTVSGGTGPYTFVTGFGGLPPGLTLSRTGVISGTPAGTNGFGFLFELIAIDANGFTGRQSFSMSVALPLTLPAAALPDGVVGAPYGAFLSASGNGFPFQYTVTGGALPPGLALDVGGSIGGTPSLSGVYTFTVTATDIFGQTASQTYAILVN